MGNNESKNDNRNCCISEEQDDELEDHKNNCCLSNFYMCLFVTESCICNCLERINGV